MRSFGRLFGAGVLGAIVIASPRPLLAQAPPGTPQGNAPNAPAAPPVFAPAPPPNIPGAAPIAPPTPVPQGTGNSGTPQSSLPGTGTAGGRAPAANPNAKPTPQAPIPDVASASNVNDMTSATPGGLTADQVAERAAQTSYQAKAAEKNVASAEARADAAWANYVPRFGLTARYTRLSDFTPPSLGSGSLVVTQAPAGTPNPPSIAGGSFSFPLVLDQWLAQATIAVPISDYFLRIGKGYTAATKSVEAAQHDIVAARAKSYSDGKIAYFTWLRARGAVVVAEQSLAVARAHLKDAENQFNVGNASKSDVLRAQTQVAAAELSVERAKSGVQLTERSVRVAMHAKDDEALAPAESLDGSLPPTQGQLRELVDEAHRQRAEIKSIDKNTEAARKLAEVQSAGKYPVLSAFGDVTYANPNQRRFPQANEWFPTWAVGAQITWSPNDLLTAGANGTEAESRASALEAQKAAVRDGIELEVTQAYQAIIEADTAITTTKRQLESALEGYRVARELFNNGRGTATTLIDAEIVLAQTRFEHLNARVDARIARARLDHALGRDAKGGAAPTP
ncbi:MAG: TolC family protein [Deltaproteobacteria bacterium]|nr:TolC family protein [Deltaproteobacteria bacterium]